MTNTDVANLPTPVFVDSATGFTITLWKDISESWLRGNGCNMDTTWIPHGYPKNTVTQMKVECGFSRETTRDPRGFPGIHSITSDHPKALGSGGVTNGRH